MVSVLSAEIIGSNSYIMDYVHIHIYTLNIKRYSYYVHMSKHENRLLLDLLLVLSSP